MKDRKRVVLTATTCAARVGFVDQQGVAEQVPAVENQHGTHRFFVVGYFDETETSRLAGMGSRMMFLKPIPQLLFVRQRGQIAHVKLHPYTPSVRYDFAPPGLEAEYVDRSVRESQNQGLVKSIGGGPFSYLNTSSRYSGEESTRMSRSIFPAYAALLHHSAVGRMGSTKISSVPPQISPLS